MVALKIDRVDVNVERGTTLLEAAQQYGIRIPTLCYDKRLPPYGGCGICIVEVYFRGGKLTVPACATFVDDGMEVVTHTPEIIASRCKQLMLLLRTHPLDCPTCDAAGDCRLQELVHEYAIPELLFTRKTRDHYVDTRCHFIRFDMNVCIKCGLCARICNLVQGESQLSLVHRGIDSEVSTSFRRPLNCEFCGQCAQICPGGAISSKWLKRTGRRFEVRKTRTVCSFCSLGCTLTLNAKDGNVVYVTSPPESPNEGNLCVKGRYGWPYVYSEQRLTRPLIRKQGKLEEVTWDEALCFVADRFSRIKEESGGTGLAALGSARLTNEEAYVFNRFVRTVLETPHLDHGGGLAYQALVAGLGSGLPYPASTNSIREIRNAQVVLLLGADLSETHPVAKNEVILATSPERKGRAIVVDSVRTKLCDRPGIHLVTVPGTEHLIPYAMLREIIEKDLHKREALDLIGGGVNDLVSSLKDYSPDHVAESTGTDPEMIRQAAVMYADASTATVILTAGMNMGSNKVALARAAVNLALVSGRIGKESCGVHLFSEKANSQGAVDMGLVPDLLPGFQSMLDSRARERFEAQWQSPLPKERGLDAHSILKKAANGEIRGLYVVGENPLDTYPDRKLMEGALERLELLVVQDMFLTSTAKKAHVLLPVCSFAEKSGTYTNAERRVQLLRPILKMSGPKSDLEIFQALSARMGNSSLRYAGPEEVMQEIAELVEVYREISYALLDEQGIQWPYLDPDYSADRQRKVCSSPQASDMVTKIK
jgi:predicted molibdopterin-dependent oxidoreductase YjgC